jgi:hypothetical protein
MRNHALLSLMLSLITLVALSLAALSRTLLDLSNSLSNSLLNWFSSHSLLAVDLLFSCALCFLSICSLSLSLSLSLLCSALLFSYLLFSFFASVRASIVVAGWNASRFMPTAEGFPQWLPTGKDLYVLGVTRCLFPVLGAFFFRECAMLSLLFQAKFGHSYRW